jgi:hypothetical protein
LKNKGDPEKSASPVAEKYAVDDIPLNHYAMHEDNYCHKLPQPMAPDRIWGFAFFN